MERDDSQASSESEVKDLFVDAEFEKSLKDIEEFCSSHPTNRDVEIEIVMPNPSKRGLAEYLAYLRKVRDKNDRALSELAKLRKRVSSTIGRMAKCDSKSAIASHTNHIGSWGKVIELGRNAKKYGEDLVRQSETVSEARKLVWTAYSEFVDLKSSVKGEQLTDSQSGKLKKWCEKWAKILGKIALADMELQMHSVRYSFAECAYGVRNDCFHSVSNCYARVCDEMLTLVSGQV